jgi:predicted RNA-binding Zn-ribbon protein involved in translation (DUF1610 family)
MIDPPDATALHPRLEIDTETTTVYITTDDDTEYQHEITLDNWELLKSEQPPTYYCPICDIVCDDECKNPFSHHYDCPNCDTKMQWIICILSHSRQ